MAVASNVLFQGWQALSSQLPRLPNLAAAGVIRPSAVQHDRSYIVLTVAGTYTFESAALNPLNSEFTVVAQAAVTANGVTLADGEFATFRVTLDSNGANQWDLIAASTTVVDALFADDVPLVFGTGEDVELLWSTADADNHGFVIGLGDTSQMLHITDKAADASDWAITSPTHPTVYVHSNTTPITDYLSIGAHDGTTATINNVGGTTIALAIAGTVGANVLATGIQFNDNIGTIFGTGSDITVVWDATKLAITQAAANSSIDMGVDGAGIDVIFRGDTAGVSMTWDQSADSLILTDNGKVVFGTGSDIAIAWNATNLAITQAAPNSAIDMGVDGAGIDVIFRGDTASQSLTWDQSADSLVATSLVGINGAGSTSSVMSPNAAQQNLSGAGAVNITTYYTAYTSTGGAQALTLANGAQIGQLKKIAHVVDGGSGVLTPTSLSGGTTITFTTVGEFALLKWNGTAWVALELGNSATPGTPPVLA